MLVKKKIKIDITELMNAFEGGSWEMKYYLDLKTGKIELISGCEEDEELEQKIEEQFNTRYISIHHIDAHESYRDMERFIDTLEDVSLIEKLNIALNGRGAFRRFKDVLLNYPSERKKWFTFKDELIKERVMAWLEEEEIDAK